jgi:hypothetical protein
MTAALAFDDAAITFGHQRHAADRLALAGGHHVIALERQLADEPTIVRERMAD